MKHCDLLKTENFQRLKNKIPEVHRDVFMDYFCIKQISLWTGFKLVNQMYAKP